MENGSKKNENEKKYKVYVYKNKLNGKMYVGQTCRTLKERAGKNGNLYYQCIHFGNAIKKYGWANFEVKIIFDNLTREKANEKEKQMIRLLRTCEESYGYNISAGGTDNTYCALDITGKKFGRWTALKLTTTPDGHTGRYWLCKCDCGTIKIVRQCNLTSGSTHSCGCYSVDKSSKIIPNEYYIKNNVVYIQLNNNKELLVDLKDYNEKLCNLHFYYDSANNRVLGSYDININKLIFPFLKRTNCYKYIRHKNGNMFDFTSDNLFLDIPTEIQNKDEFIKYLSDNTHGISLNLKYKNKWTVKKNVVDSREHSFFYYTEAKNFVMANCHNKLEV